MEDADAELILPMDSLDFKKSRIEVLSNDYLHILSAILEQPSILIEHIGLSGSNEEEENALDSIQLNF